LMHNNYTGCSIYSRCQEVESLDNPFDNNYYIGLITITFDRKFVFFQRQSDQLDYINQSIYNAFHGSNKDYIFVYSIEHQKDGVLHAHMMIQHKVNNNMSYTNIVNYRYALGLYFTDRCTSFMTVRLDDVSSTRINSETGNSGSDGALDYIKKEKFKYYKSIFEINI